jgi:hypothetical protein
MATAEPRITKSTLAAPPSRLSTRIVPGVRAARLVVLPLLSAWSILRRPSQPEAQQQYATSLAPNLAVLESTVLGARLVTRR